MRIMGVVFCVVWAWSIVLFPLLKGQIRGYLPVFLGVVAAGVMCHGGIRKRVGARLMKPSTRAFLVTIVAAALVLRFLPLLIVPARPMSDALGYHNAARSIVAGDGYGQTAFFPPGWAFLLSVWYRLIPAHPTAGKILGGILGTISVLLVYDLARRSLGLLAARWAGLLAAVMPTLVFTSAGLGTTALLTLLVLVTAELVLIRSALSGGRGLLVTLLLGGVLGFATLVKPVFLLVPAIVFLGWVALDLGLLRAGVNAALCAIVMACVVLPWTARNYRVLGGFVPVSTNGGVVLYSGTNAATNGMCVSVEPMPGAKDEISQDRQFRRAALARIVDNPIGFCVLAAKKQAYMWGTSSTLIGDRVGGIVPERLHSTVSLGTKAVVNVFWAGLLVLCIRGTLVTSVWSRRPLRFLLLVLLYIFVLHILFEVQSRYHVPVVSALLVVAAAGLSVDGDEPEGEENPLAD